MLSLQNGAIQNGAEGNNNFKNGLNVEMDDASGSQMLIKVDAATGGASVAALLSQKDQRPQVHRGLAVSGDHRRTRRASRRGAIEGTL